MSSDKSIRASRYREIARRRHKASRSVFSISTSVTASEVSDILTVDTGLLGNESMCSSDSTVPLMYKMSQHTPNVISPTNSLTKNEGVQLAKAEATIIELRKELKDAAVNEGKCSGSCSCACTRKLEKQVSVLNKTVNDLRTQLGQALSSAVTRSANISMLRIQNKELNDELEDYKQMHKTIKKFEEEVMKLTTENEELKKEDTIQNQKTELTLESERNRIHQLEKERNWMKECLEESKEWRRTGREELDRTIKTVDELKSENESLKSRVSLNLQKEVQINELQANLEMIEKAYESVTNDIRSIRVERDTCEANVLKLSSDLKGKENELIKAKMIATSAFVTISDLEHQLGFLNEGETSIECPRFGFDSEI